MRFTTHAKAANPNESCFKVAGRCAARLCRRVGAIIFAIGLTVTGCTSSALKPLMPTPLLYTELGRGPLDHIPEGERWKPRRVYFATTRERLPNLQRIDYGNKEAPLLSIGMALIGFGAEDISWSDLNRYSREAERDRVVDLSISGLVEAGKLDARPDSGAFELTGAAAWLVADLKASIGSARDRDLLIYVHGAKVNFYNACVFAAQLDHFMGRDMVSLAFAWPSRQNIVAYGTGGDVKRAYRSAEAFASLLEVLARESGARRIHIVCWSAGGRLVSSALSELRDRYSGLESKELRQRLRIGTVYFAAADVPGDEFIDRLPAINEVATRVVVTASEKDGALKKAKLLMGGGTRIGSVKGDLTPDQQKTVLAADRLEVIDVSRGWLGRGFDITGHSYWFDHPWASSDLILAVRSDFGPADRALEPTDHAMLWTIPEDYPSRLRSILTRPGLQLRGE